MRVLPTPYLSSLSPSGGAISLVESPSVVINHALFINNQAQTGSSGADVAYACGKGHGGALCFVGIPGSNMTVQTTLFLNNTAVFGGGVSLHADTSCTLQQLSEGCFLATFGDSCKFSNNTAADGAGGAVFWTRPGNLNISCGSGQSGPAAIGDAYSEFAGSRRVTPCDDWAGNRATGYGYGPAAASTSFYLRPTTLELPYYTSNEILPLQVSAQVRVQGMVPNVKHLFRLIV